MAKLNILQYPDPRLYTIAKAVSVIDDAIQQLIADMAETMYAANGIGLAATQVDVHQQVIVMDLSDTRDQLQVFINPVIVWASQETHIYEEGCLSVPGIYDKLSRAKEVLVQAMNQNKEPFELKADGLLAVCIQHEIDHLKGRVFVDYLSRLKQGRIKKKLEKRLRD